ncbi:redoxin domain-containing protein [Ornithinibacillus gellani]|uniref:SCO family protein n=1 Tax=Ornithinibacillus gellani TaxID=2293253 RepID=UPI000F48F74E|nr:SCO family protein [Ornithinibacillus gellani]TQS76650.1 redoxin domain-containing protein [Ornithinibacillus gellani]
MVNGSKRKKIAIGLIFIFGILLYYVGTDGFTAFTAETARVNQLVEEQPDFPNVTLEDSNNRTYSFSEFEGKYVLITFIYTNCTTVCLDLEMNMAQVYNKIPTSYIGEDIVFLSISFDPERDDPATLHKYKDYFNSDGETWRMARIADQQELDNLLDEFGVIVIPDNYGNFAHNSAFYLVDQQGTLLDVMDYTDIDGSAKKIEDYLTKGGKG